MALLAVRALAPYAVKTALVMKTAALVKGVTPNSQPVIVALLLSNAASRPVLTPTGRLKGFPTVSLTVITCVLLILLEVVVTLVRVSVVSLQFVMIAHLLVLRSQLAQL